jgi:hypothetical protein
LPAQSSPYIHGDENPAGVLMDRRVMSIYVKPQVFAIRLALTWK